MVPYFLLFQMRWVFFSKSHWTKEKYFFSRIKISDDWWDYFKIPKFSFSLWLQNEFCSLFFCFLPYGGFFYFDHNQWKLLNTNCYYYYCPCRCSKIFCFVKCWYICCFDRICVLMKWYFSDKTFIQIEIQKPLVILNRTLFKMHLIFIHFNSKISSKYWLIDFEKHFWLNIILHII